MPSPSHVPAHAPQIPPRLAESRRPLTPSETREAAALLCEGQAEAFEWQAGRRFALAGDQDTARMLRELAARIRGMDLDAPSVG